MIHRRYFFMEERNKQALEETEEYIIDAVKQQWHMLQSIQNTKTLLLEHSQASAGEQEEEHSVQNDYEKPIPAPIRVQIDVNA